MEREDLGIQCWQVYIKLGQEDAKTIINLKTGCLLILVAYSVKTKEHVLACVIRFKTTYLFLCAPVVLCMALL